MKQALCGLENNFLRAGHSVKTNLETALFETKLVLIWHPNSARLFHFGTAWIHFLR
jgi:hypothetical protein